MLTREFLISRGECCSLGCRNCPYEPKKVKGCVVLPEVNPELISSFLASTGNFRDKSVKMYAEMFEQQPTFKLLFDAALTAGWSQDKLDGYCKGMLQAWHLLNQQSIVEDLK